MIASIVRALGEEGVVSLAVDPSELDYLHHKVVQSKTSQDVRLLTMTRMESASSTLPVSEPLVSMP